MTDLERACAILAEGGHTCVLCRGEQTYTSALRGVAPMVAWLSAGTELAGASAADKVVGKAAALLFALGGVRAVYAPVMSRSACACLARHGITARYDTLTDGIVRRDGAGPCPMEAAVADIDDPAQALAAIVHKLKELSGT